MPSFAPYKGAGQGVGDVFAGEGELRIELHGQANPVHDGVVAALCTELNSTETPIP